jgi:hypothetical protein
MIIKISSSVIIIITTITTIISRHACSQFRQNYDTYTVLYALFITITHTNTDVYKQVLTSCAHIQAHTHAHTKTRICFSQEKLREKPVLKDNDWYITHTHTHTHTHSHTHTHTHTCRHTHAHTRTHTHTHAHTHTHTHTHI